MVMLEFAAKTASGDSVKLTTLDNMLAGSRAGHVVYN